MKIELSVHVFSKIVLLALTACVLASCSVEDRTSPALMSGSTEPASEDENVVDQSGLSQKKARLDAKAISKLAIDLVSERREISPTTLTADVTDLGASWWVIVWMEPRKVEGSFVLKIASEGEILWESSNLKTSTHRQIEVPKDE